MLDDDLRPDVLISDLPAVALTGYVTPEYATRLREAGFDVYMPKPAEPDDLVGKVAVLARSGRP